MTHQLLGPIVDSVHRRLEQMCITCLRNDLFHAELIFDAKKSNLSSSRSAQRTVDRSVRVAAPAMGQPRPLRYSASGVTVSSTWSRVSARPAPSRDYSVVIPPAVLEGMGQMGLEYETAHDTVVRSAGEMHRAGVCIVSGTDRGRECQQTVRPAV